MEKAKFIIKVVTAVVAVASLTLGVLTYLGVTPIRISAEGIKSRIDDIDLRIDKIELEIEQMKAQGEEVTWLESELSAARLLNIEANNEWHIYDFDTAHEKVQEANGKVMALELEIYGSQAPPPNRFWGSVLIGLGAVLLFLVIVLVFRTRRV